MGSSGSRATPAATPAPGQQPRRRGLRRSAIGASRLSRALTAARSTAAAGARPAGRRGRAGGGLARASPPAPAQGHAPPPITDTTTPPPPAPRSLSPKPRRRPRYLHGGLQGRGDRGSGGGSAAAVSAATSSPNHFRLRHPRTPGTQHLPPPRAGFRGRQSPEPRPTQGPATPPPGVRRRPPCTRWRWRLSATAAAVREAAEQTSPDRISARRQAASVAKPT